MLKITLLDSADEFRFLLEGKLSGLWVAELRQCWQTASSITQGRRTVLDMREVDFVDGAGESLLCDMSGSGVSLLVSSPFMQSVIEGISHDGGYGRVEETSSRSSDAVVRTHPSRPHSRAV
jgi:ABC-type transporter Mla MlaB component